MILPRHPSNPAGEPSLQVEIASVSTFLHSPALLRRKSQTQLSTVERFEKHLLFFITLVG